ncbi:helix-turn-helix transcriptional regulator [Lampropedia aestuarii]|uniref:Helix-turn-helix transcriptional regulator n=1 Tax=Lampropedia aestuarii TaxID=2562762 RepID=A0A4S5C167_9BURK|nr:AraC family transcriptional regulator [Lampropedia aestuarii]THJ36136.1 helix-turn-helix transcriptional regulator [Lampropedia aestuarii]
MIPTSDQTAPRTTAECTHSYARLGARTVTIATPHLVSGPICRPTMNLLFSLNGRPFSLHINSQQVLQTTAALVMPGQLRAVTARDCALLSISVEPGHALFQTLQQATQGQSMQALKLQPRSEAFEQLGRCYNDTAQTPVTNALLIDILAQSGLATAQRVPTRPRATTLLQAVDAKLPERTGAADLASQLGLSTSRLSHVFVAEVGMPLRSYALWQRYRLALKNLESGTGLSHIASESGFADAAHMTNTFMKYLGFPPSEVAKRCRISFRTAAS